jgi:CBS domain-containing protein
VTVRDALLHPRVLQGGASVAEVAELLTRPNVESVLVADDERLLGCVTKQEIVRAVAAGGDLRELRARDLCDPDVTSVGPDTPLEEALHLMAEKGLERLVVTENGRLLGVLPREPLVRRLAEDEPPAEPKEAPGETSL